MSAYFCIKFNLLQLTAENRYVFLIPIEQWRPSLQIINMSGVRCFIGLLVPGYPIPIYIYNLEIEQTYNFKL